MEGVVIFLSDYAPPQLDAVYMTNLEDGALLHLNLLTSTGSMAPLGAHFSDVSPYARSRHMEKLQQALPMHLPAVLCGDWNFTMGLEDRLQFP